MAPCVQSTPLEVGSSVGRLRVSNRSEPGPVLAGRLDDDGYLFLPGFHLDADVRAAQGPMVEHLARAGALHPDRPPHSLVAKPGSATTWVDGLADNNDALYELLYGSRTISFFDGLFGEPTRHYDFTWSRAMSAGQGTPPHCDIVYMGRGTPRVHTMWTAMCDIPEHVGGLCILEGSHRDHDDLRAYRRSDVDTYCENLGDAPVASLGAGGALPFDDVNEVRSRFGRRWLWSDYRAGDVLIFTMTTIHASLDNHSDRLRISTDTRYQPASQPIDERWVGDSPIGHSLAAQRGRIC